MRNNLQILDPLYGEISISDEIGKLVFLPPIQRLRHVRLSNIDSLTMPGISGLSRYEHVIGAYYLATQSGFARKLPREERLEFFSAALLHDWAITPSGHLVEEAFSFLGQEIKHEDKLKHLLHEQDPNEIGGVQRQMLYGRESGLSQWSREVFGEKWEEGLTEITTAISGGGKFGPCISGPLDVDNLDNVSRIAFHMGLELDKHLPLKIAKTIVNCDKGKIVFEASGVALINDWLALRANVYEHLMTSRPDFSGKLMLIHASMWAHEDGLLKASDWAMNDIDFFAKLLGASSKRVREVVQRWFAGEFWDLSKLTWFESSKAPSFESVKAFSGRLTTCLGKDCYAYRIKDKRTRSVEVLIEDGVTVHLGRDSNYWLLGVGSSRKEDFSSAEESKILSEAIRFFEANPVQQVESSSQNTPDLFLR